MPNGTMELTVAIDGATLPLHAVNCTCSSWLMLDGNGNILQESQKIVLKSGTVLILQARTGIRFILSTNGLKSLSENKSGIFLSMQ